MKYEHWRVHIAGGVSSKELFEGLPEEALKKCWEDARVDLAHDMANTLRTVANQVRNDIPRMGLPDGAESRMRDCLDVIEKLNQNLVNMGML